MNQEVKEQKTEVTHEMIEAGENAYINHWGDRLDIVDLGNVVPAIYIAMDEAKKRSFR